jgi:hypothetical protein
MRDDSDLQALFRKQRGEDELLASAFDDVLGRARRGPAAGRVGLRSRWVIAAVALLTVGTFATLRWHERLMEEEEAGSLASELTAKVWRAPTDFLLQLPASDLTRSVPTFRVPLPMDGTLRDVNPRDTNTVRTRRTES